MPSSPRPTSPAAAPTGSTPSSWGRIRLRWWWIALVAVIAPLLLFAGLPSLARFPKVRNWLLQRMANGIQGTVEAERLTIGWSRPTEVTGVTLRAPEGQEVLAIPRISGGPTFWSLLTSPGRLGRFVIERPQLHMHVTPHGNSLEAALAKSSRTGTDRIRREQLEKLLLRNVAITIEIRDGTFTFERPERPSTWSVGDLNVAIGLQPAQRREDASWIVLEEGDLLRQVLITPQITDDLLQFIAPFLANATSIEGGFSLHIDHAVFPLDDFPAGTCEGLLTIHHVRAGPGPLVREILKYVPIQESWQVMGEQTIRFRLRDGAVWHDACRFDVGKLQIETSGQVGLDQRIDMWVRLRLPEPPVEPADGRRYPLLRLLGGRPIELPLVGSLRRPKLDIEAFLERGISQYPELLRLTEELPELWNQARQRLADRARARGEAAGPSVSTEQAPKGRTARPVLDRLRRWRESLDPSSSPDATNPPEGPEQGEAP